MWACRWEVLLPCWTAVDIPWRGGVTGGSPHGSGVVVCALPTLYSGVPTSSHLPAYATGALHSCLVKPHSSPGIHSSAWRGRWHGGGLARMPSRVLAAPVAYAFYIVTFPGPFLSSLL